MSKFTKPLKVEIVNYGREFKLLESIEYYRENNQNEVIEVPTGFISDFASIPRMFWGILPPLGAGKKQNYSPPALLHDYLYDASCKHNFTRKEADDIFLEAMSALGVRKITKYTLYYCVRWFGNKYYKK